MFEVSQTARTKAAAFLQGRQVKPIRVYVSVSGSQKTLAIALDQVRTTDAVYEIDGVTYVINRDFLDLAQPVHIDYGPDGFEISAHIDLKSAACAGCKAAGKCGR